MSQESSPTRSRHIHRPGLGNIASGAAIIGNPYSSISLNRLGQEALRQASTTPSQENTDSTPGSPVLDRKTIQQRVKAEDFIEVICNGVLVPPEMTLAAVRQFIWMVPMPTGFKSALEDDHDVGEEGPSKGGEDGSLKAVDLSASGMLGGGQSLPFGGDVMLHYRIKRRGERQAVGARRP